MRTPFVLLKPLSLAVLRAGDRLEDGSLAAALPDIVREVWPRWSGGATEEQLRRQLQSLIRAPADLVRRHAERLADRAARGLSDDAVDQLTDYLRLVPVAVRNALRRPTDPSGTTVPAWLPLLGPENLIRLLPDRLPKNEVGAELNLGPCVRLTELLGITARGESWLATTTESSPRQTRVHFDYDPRDRLRERTTAFAEVVRMTPTIAASRVLAAHSDAQSFVTVSEWVPGGSLASLLREWRHELAMASSPEPWLTERADKLLLDLARAVAVCHRHDPPLVLGQLGMDTILVRIERGRPRPSLGECVVSASSEGDPREDVLALGTIWYRMLNGDLTDRPGDVRRLGTGHECLDLLTACLADDPEARPADAHELAERLAASLGEHEIKASATAAPRGKGGELVVCAAGRGQYQTIRAAVTAARVGSRILVQPGVYREAIDLFKSVEIVGDGPPGSVVVENDAGDCVHAAARGAVVRNLTLRGTAGSRGRKYYCVEVVNGDLLLEDCELTSDSLSCLAVHGRLSRPTIRRCIIRDGRSGGVFCYRGAKPLIEDCDIFGHRAPGVEVTGGASPTLRRCKVHHQTEHNGVMVYGGGLGLFEDCDIFSNRYADVRIHDGGNPTLRRCTIREGGSCGVFVLSKGLGLLEDCEVFGHVNAEVEVGGAESAPTLRRCKVRGSKMACLFFYDHAGGLVEECEASGSAAAVVELKNGAAPTLRRCKIHGGQSTGLLLWENCRGVFEQCQVFGNVGNGASIKTGGDPTLKTCRIRDGQKGGVVVSEKGRVALEDCDLAGNALANLEVSQGSEAVLRRSRLRDGKQVGALVHHDGRAVMEDCEIKGNRSVGLEVRQGGRPELLRCRVREGSQGGVLVHEEGRGRLDECVLAGNGGAAVEILGGGHLILRRCRIERGKHPGVWAHARGGGTVEQCELSGEAGEAWRLEEGCRVLRAGNKE